MKILGLGLVAVFLFLVQRLVYKKCWDKELSVSVTFAQKGIVEGEAGEIIEVVENRKLLPLTSLKIGFQTSKNLEFADAIGSKTTDQYYRNDVFQVGGGEKLTRRLSFRGKQRGYYHIKNIDLAGTDLFLIGEFLKRQSTNAYLYVYPKMLENESFQTSLQKLNGDVLVKRHLVEDPFEYRGIREYQPFDDIRSVNWKATARTGGLKVNQKNYTSMQTVRIFLNLDDKGAWKHYKETEAAIQIVMGLSEMFLRQGIKVACYANSRDVLTDEPVKIAGGAGTGQQDTIAKALARIDIHKETSDFVSMYKEQVLDDRDGLITLFVSVNGYGSFTSLLKECMTYGMDYCWFYPYVGKEKPDVPGDVIKGVQFVKLK